MIKSIYEKIVNLVQMRSLRARIFLITFIMGVVPCFLVRFAIVTNYASKAIEVRAGAVQNQLMIIANHLISNDYLSPDFVKTSVSGKVIDAELEVLADLYEGRVMIVNKNFRVVEDTYNLSIGKTIISEEVILCFNGENTIHYDDNNGYIEITTPITDTTTNSTEIKGVMLTSISDSTVASMSDVLNRNAMILEILMLILLLVLSHLVSAFLVRPFERVTKAIGEVKAGYTNEPISVPDYVETVHIVDAFNQLQKRMQVLDDSRNEFVANVSHELKTPMASIKVLSDSLLQQPDAPVELYREFMGDIASEIDRENRIITDLLALVKMDKKSQVLNYTSLNINELTELILKRLRPIARKKDVEVILESNREIVAEVDEVKMSLVMTNLVENAIKYNKEHGSVHVILDADHQYFTFEVKDTGIGIPEESLAHIYERFYRVDKSHSREIGGTGLGLAITRSAILMHRGSISVTSTEGEGSSFLVKIPLSHVAQKG